jgi:hypothetical protein
MLYEKTLELTNYTTKQDCGILQRCAVRSLKSSVESSSTSDVMRESRYHYYNNFSKVPVHHNCTQLKIPLPTIQQANKEWRLTEADENSPLPENQSEVKVEDFKVKWDKEKYTNVEEEIAEPGFLLEISAKLNTRNPYALAFIEYRQKVASKIEIYDEEGNPEVTIEQEEDDDNYSRKDNSDKTDPYENPNFKTNDHPSIGGGYGKKLSAAQNINYTFTAQQEFYDRSTGAERVIARKGPHTATITGKHPREWKGVPKEL